MLVALFGVLALGALTAAAAQAVEAPRWSIAGTDLPEGKTHFITAKTYTGSFTLKGAGNTITCKAISLEEGVLLGSAAGNAGKNNEIVEFTECSVEGPGVTKCKIGPILTNPLISELVETEKAEPEKTKGSLLVLFEPAPGSNGFATLKFTAEKEGKCPAETIVTGSVAAQVLTDPEKPPTLGTLVTLEGGATEANSWLLNFPATAIRKVTRISGGKSSEKAVELFSFSEESVEAGVALILLGERNAKGELVTEASPKKWSPLP
jgi:hypothetical protein